MPRKRRSEKRIVNADGLRSISSIATAKSVCSYVVALLAQAGMRRGETCALSLQDLDFAERVIHIGASIDRFGKRKEPKSEEGFRDIPMTDGAEATLRGAIESFRCPSDIIRQARCGVARRLMMIVRKVIGIQLQQQSRPDDFTVWPAFFVVGDTRFELVTPTVSR